MSSKSKPMKKWRDLGQQPARAIAKKQGLRLRDIQTALDVPSYATVVNCMLGRAAAPRALFDQLPRFLESSVSKCWTPAMIAAVEGRQAR